MTLYTEGLNIRPNRNLLEDYEPGQLEAAAAAYQEQAFHNPASAARRMQEIRRSEMGELLFSGDERIGLPELRIPPETPLLSAEDARARVQESGLDLSIEDSGIREGTLEILMDRKRAEMARQRVLQNAPASTLPVQLLAGFAASALDPINVASAFIPVVGPARYSSMIANAGSGAARFGVRARVGAVQGAVGAVAVEPFSLLASAQDQTDYGMVDSLMNIAFGTVLGGGLHATGGAISDMRAAKLLRDLKAQTSIAPEVDAPAPIQSVQRNPLAEAIARDGDDAMVSLRRSFERAIAADRERLSEEARSTVIDELASNISEELEEIMSGRVPNAGSLKKEQAAIATQLQRLDEKFKPLAKQFQGQRMSRKQAEKAAREAIEQERQQLGARQGEIANQLDGNRQAELARADLAKVARGEIPEKYAQRIEDRVAEMMEGFQPRNTARAVAEAAPFAVREAALRSAFAQIATGRPVEVQAIFDLVDPAKRQKALDRIKSPAAREPDPEGLAASQLADETVSNAAKDDLDAINKLIADDEALTRELAEQSGLDIEPMLREANELVRDAATYAASLRAAAICQLRA